MGKQSITLRKSKCFDWEVCNNPIQVAKITKMNHKSKRQAGK